MGTNLHASQPPVKSHGDDGRPAWQPVIAFGYAAAMDKTSTRDAIKALALELLIRHGYRGANFGDIASGLATTRANIHYHFGNKQMLVEEVLTNYVDATLTAVADVWAKDSAFSSKVDAMIDYSRERYRRYNPAGTEGRPWSLISRLRQDADLLSPAGRNALKRFGEEMSAILTDAIEKARRRGEFSAALPVEDVALQLVTLADNAAPITIEAGNFGRLERLYRSFAGIVLRAFGPE